MLVTSLQSLFFLLSVSLFLCIVKLELPSFRLPPAKTVAPTRRQRGSHTGGAKVPPPPPKKKRGKKYKKTPEVGSFFNLASGGHCFSTAEG